MSCGCSSTPLAYLQCAGVPVAPPIVDDNTLVTLAAQAGAKSSDFTMCLAVAELKARRMIYWKVSPGDCGSNNFYYTSTTSAEAQGLKLLGSATSLDPEPISKAILSGIDAIFGGFLAAHAQAVQTEEQTLCKVAITFNQAITQLEKAVATGQVSAADASAFLQGQASQLDEVMATIYKVCNAACGYRIGMRALVAFYSAYVFKALSPLIAGLGPITAPIQNFLSPQNPSASAGTPGSGTPLFGPSSGPLTSGVPTMAPTSISLPGGEGGLILVGGGLIAARLAGVL